MTYPFINTLYTKSPSINKYQKKNNHPSSINIINKNILFLLLFFLKIPTCRGNAFHENIVLHRLEDGRNGIRVQCARDMTMYIHVFGCLGSTCHEEFISDKVATLFYILLAIVVHIFFKIIEIVFDFFFQRDPVC